MELKEIQLEDVACRSGKCVPLKDALGQPGPWDGLLHSHPDFHGGEGGILGAGRGTEKAPCCLRWAPFEGRIKMLFGHTHRQERGQEGGGAGRRQGQLDGGKKAAVRVCMCTRGERKRAGSKTRRKAKPREGCHCEGRTAAAGPRGDGPGRI